MDFLTENLIILYNTNQRNETNIIHLHTSIISIHSSYYFSFKINCSESYFTVTQLWLTPVLTVLVQVIKSYVVWLYNSNTLSHINGCMSENADSLWEEYKPILINLLRKSLPGPLPTWPVPYLVKFWQLQAMVGSPVGSAYNLL